MKLKKQIWNFMLVLALALAFVTSQAQAAPSPQDENPPVSALALNKNISAGGEHTCMINNNGTVTCRGAGSFGNPPGQSTPLTGTFSQVSAGGQHTCGLKNNSTILCWGDDSYGQSSNPFPAATFKQVSVGDQHSCGLKSNNTIACWGDNFFHQSDVPAGVFLQVSAGGYHTCAIKSNGTLQCWGSDTNGQSNHPSGTFYQVSAGNRHTCGVKSDGTLACWGLNGNGQSSPPGGTFIQVDAGASHTCGLKSDGTITCWGDNSFGQSTPPAGTFTQVSAGDHHTCAQKSAGTYVCWGDNTYGQVKSPTISGSVGVAGATINIIYTDLVKTFTKTIKSNSKGIYSFQIPYYNWNVTVKPVSNSGVSFAPVSILRNNVLTDQAGLNFQANRIKSLTSVGTQDGWIIESTETSGIGGNANNNSTSIIVGDDNKNRQYRSILSFSTDVLPDNAVITSVKLKLKKLGGIGINPFTTHDPLLVEMNRYFFGDTPSLELDDFSTNANAFQAGTVNSIPVGGYFISDFKPGVLSRINRTGRTQLRLRFQLDDNNDNIANYLRFYSGESTTAANRPTLEIVYHVPLP